MSEFYLPNHDGQFEQIAMQSDLNTKITNPSGGTAGQVLTKTASGEAWEDAQGGAPVTTNVLKGDGAGGIAAAEEQQATLADLRQVTLTTINYNPDAKTAAMTQAVGVGSDGKLYTTPGSELPSQHGQSGKFLTTDGSNTSWGTVDALPSQSGQSGKFLTTNGSSASWSVVDALPAQSGHNGEFLTTNGSSASWSEPDEVTLIDLPEAPKPDLGTVTTSSSWSGNDPYTQTVTVSGATVTATTKVDIQLTTAQIKTLTDEGVQALSIDNNNGTLTLNSIGAHYDTAMTMQVTCTEVTL